MWFLSFSFCLPIFFFLFRQKRREREKKKLLILLNERREGDWGRAFEIKKVKNRMREWRKGGREKHEQEWSECSDAAKE